MPNKKFMKDVMKISEELHRDYYDTDDNKGRICAGSKCQGCDMEYSSGSTDRCIFMDLILWHKHKGQKLHVEEYKTHTIEPTEIRDRFELIGEILSSDSSDKSTEG